MPQAEYSSTASPRRLPEAIALFNSAFATELLVNACWFKSQHGSEGLPWPAAFLILPLTLHPPTRQELPRDSRLTLAAWAVAHPQLTADMDHRVAVMAEPTKRAIRRGLRVGRLGLVGTNLVALAKPRNPTAAWPEELATSTRAARICGRWFNGIQTAFALELLGIGK
ncbi:three component ABC system middle component [Mycolicibacterium sediminis]|uniref:Uncharacterized protein n=1 Tax=Mycolicibacterium sediminis TaxID=1286180 RepID=A0A7I7QQY7_9MYCO|nr:hypothetical protein MSEDJ_28300 [Mycolicibacterium sediminis]